MRRLLSLVLPGGFHRIRHYGLRANGSRMSSLALARELLCQPAVAATPADRGDFILCNAAFDVWLQRCETPRLTTGDDHLRVRPVRGRRPELRGRLERAMLLGDDFQEATMANTCMRRPETKV